MLSCCLSKSFAQEKTKTEKESKFKLPDWLDLYADVGYVYGKNYKFRSGSLYDINGRLDIYGQNFYDLTIGGCVLYKFEKVPMTFDIIISNLYDGLKDNKQISPLYGKYESSPFYTLGTGPLINYSNYTINPAIFYSRNFKSKNVFKNLSFLVSVSKLYKEFTINVASRFNKKDSDYYIWKESKYRKVSEEIISLEMNLFYNFKHLSPYLLINRDIFDFSHNKYLFNNNPLIFSAGFHISTFKKSSINRRINGRIFPVAYKDINGRIYPVAYKVGYQL
jgi:hypothetical protein